MGQNLLIIIIMVENVTTRNYILPMSAPCRPEVTYADMRIKLFALTDTVKRIPFRIRRRLNDLLKFDNGAEMVGLKRIPLPPDPLQVKLLKEVVKCVRIEACTATVETNSEAISYISESLARDVLHSWLSKVKNRKARRLLERIVRDFQFTKAPFGVFGIAKLLDLRRTDVPMKWVLQHNLLAENVHGYYMLCPICINPYGRYRVPNFSVAMKDSAQHISTFHRPAAIAKQQTIPIKAVIELMLERLVTEYMFLCYSALWHKRSTKT